MAVITDSVVRGMASNEITFDDACPPPVLDLAAYVIQCRKHRKPFNRDDFENQIEQLTLSREEFDRRRTKEKHNRLFNIKALYAIRQGFMKRVFNDMAEQLAAEEAATAANGVQN